MVRAWVALLVLAGVCFGMAIVSRPIHVAAPVFPQSTQQSVSRVADLPWNPATIRLWKLLSGSDPTAEQVRAAVRDGADLDSILDWSTDRHLRDDPELWKTSVPNYMYQFHWSALQLALLKHSASADRSAIAELIRAGADVNFRNRLGETVMAYALVGENTNQQSVRQLVDAGWRPADESERIAVDIALGDGAVIDALLEDGLAPNQALVVGAPPLLIAARCNPDIDVFRRLVEAGALPSYEEFVDLYRPLDLHLVPPLVAAIETNPNPQVVAYLLDVADVSRLNDWLQSTPLMAAASAGRSPEMLEVILQYDPEINATNDVGITALDYANEDHVPEATRRFLREAGAKRGSEISREAEQ